MCMGTCAPSNTCFLWPNRVHNPNGISASSAAFAQLTSECRLACRGMSFPSKLPLPRRDLDHDLVRGSLGTPNSASQTIDSAVLEQLTVNSPYMLHWDPFAPKLVFCMDPHLIHDSLGPPESSVKRHIERFIRCCTAHGTTSLYFRIGRTFLPQPPQS